MAYSVQRTRDASEQAFLLRRDLEFESGLLQRWVAQTIGPSHDENKNRPQTRLIKELQKHNLLSKTLGYDLP